MKCKCYNHEKWLSAHDNGAEWYDSVQDGQGSIIVSAGFIQYKL